MADLGEHEGRVAVVTGGSGGIGRAISSRLSREGVRVHVFDLNPLGPDASLAARGAPPEFRRVDVGEEKEVEEAFAAVAGLEGRLDYLVCCAAVFPARSFLEISPEEWKKTLAVNLTGTFLCCRAALGAMRQQHFGRIVLFSSMIARTGAVNGAHYAASKGGILGLARTLAIEVGRHNIRVNTISPGITDTAQPRAFLSEADLEARKGRIPLGRIGRVEDMVEACLFLLGEESSYFTGQDIRVNGGSSLW